MVQFSMSRPRMEAKVLRILSNQIQTYIERIMHHDQVGSILGIQDWFNVQKSINIIYYSYRPKKKILYDYSIVGEKAFDSTQHYA